MPAVPTTQVDGVKVCDLAVKQHGSVTAFARSLGLWPEVIWNMRTRPVVSVKRIAKVAAALGVEVTDITLPAEGGGEQEDKPEPEADAA